MAGVAGRGGALLATLIVFTALIRLLDVKSAVVRADHSIGVWLQDLAGSLAQQCQELEEGERKRERETAATVARTFEECKGEDVESVVDARLRLGW